MPTCLKSTPSTKSKSESSRVKNSKNLIDSFNTTDSALAYLFIGRPTAWPTGDNNPPVPTNNFKDFYQTYDQMLSLKKISDLDAYHMVPRVAWTSGVFPSEPSISSSLSYSSDELSYSSAYAYQKESLESITQNSQMDLPAEVFNEKWLIMLFKNTVIFD